MNGPEFNTHIVKMKSTIKFCFLVPLVKWGRKRGSPTPAALDITNKQNRMEKVELHFCTGSILESPLFHHDQKLYFGLETPVKKNPILFSQDFALRGGSGVLPTAILTSPGGTPRGGRRPQNW